MDNEEEKFKNDINDILIEFNQDKIELNLNNDEFFEEYMNKLNVLDPKIRQEIENRVESLLVQLGVTNQENEGESSSSESSLKKRKRQKNKKSSLSSRSPPRKSAKKKTSSPKLKLARSYKSSTTKKSSDRSNKSNWWLF